MRNYCDIMVKSRVRMGAFLASYLSNNGRRTRRSDDGYRPYLDDKRIGIEPSNARRKPRSNQHIVARSTVPHSGGVLQAPSTEKGWTWEDIEGAAEGSIVKPHEAQSFQKRFPIANNKAKFSVKAEAPNSYAEHHMNPAAVQTVDNEKVEEKVKEKVEKALPLDEAVLVQPKPSKVQGHSVDPILRQERKEYKGQQSNQTPSAPSTLSDWFGSEKQDTQSSVDSGPNAAAIKAQNSLNRNGSVKSKITVLSRHAAQIAFSSMGKIREKVLPFVSKIPGRAYAASVVILSMSTKAKSLIVGANMKRHELVENSLLELDTGQEPGVLQEEKTKLKSDELKQLKSAQFDAKSDRPVTETVDDNHGVVGAVQLTPDSPLPRSDKDRAVVFNPVVHGNDAEASADYKMSITHEAPKSKTRNQSVLKFVSNHTNYVGVIVRALFAIVSVAILILLGFIGYAAFTGNAPSTTDIAPNTTDTSTLEPPGLDFAEQPPALGMQDRLSVGEIKELEGMLTQLGIATGPIDGLADDATRIAVQEFEAIMGYPATDGTMTKFIQGEIRGVTFERFGF